MPKIKQRRFTQMRKLDNVFEWSDYNSNNPFPKGTWKSDIFKNDNPIVLELACGKAEYSVGLGELYPDKNFIGVDIKGNRMWVGANKAKVEGMDNLRFLRAYIDHLDQFFEQGEVSEIWILFSDPYIKKERKRLTSPKFLKLYRKISDSGTVINLKTDSELLYEYTHEVIEKEGLEIVRDIKDVYSKNPEDSELSIKTYYEKKHLENGKLIKFISFRL
jgi:tRNA (guanine-N7-)-methyltransferase